MKTLKLISAALLVVISSSAFADGISKSNLKNGSSIKSPEMNWGNPEDVNSESVKTLKFINFPSPVMEWGNPEDVNNETVEDLKNESLTISEPSMEWGNPDDVNSANVEALKSL